MSTFVVPELDFAAEQALHAPRPPNAINPLMMAKTPSPERHILTGREVYYKYMEELQKLAPKPGTYVYVSNDRPVESGRTYLEIHRQKDGKIEVFSNVTAGGGHEKKEIPSIEFAPNGKIALPNMGRSTLQQWNSEIKALITSKSRLNISDLNEQLQKR
jgi:hypothetical protein